uniref:Uncharacterized protein n=1 Tax=Anguilla anguilla TaxID=7936 RepID=A0A0E9R1X8_ANGAN
MDVFLCWPGTGKQGTPPLNQIPPLSFAGMRDGNMQLCPGAVQPLQEMT